MDPMATAYMIYIGIGALIIGFLIGWIQNPINKLKLLRWITKRDYGIVYLVGKGGILKAAVVPFDGGVIEMKVGNSKGIWVFTRERIYLLAKDVLKGLDKLDLTKLEELAKEKKDVKDKIIYHGGVVPVLFLSYDSFEPMEIKGVEGKVSPIELGSILTGWVANQMAKNVHAIRNVTYIMIGILILSLIAAGLSYMTYSTVHDQILPVIKSMKAAVIQTTETNTPVMVVK